MKKIIFFLLFVSIRSFASESTTANYFIHFSEVFSHPTITEVDYSKLSSYKLNPGLFIDFEKTPPDSFGDGDKHNSNVIFNGKVSKEYFISFVNSDLISNGSLNKNAKKVFNDKTGDYSFEVKTNGEQLIIIENMLISAPDDMTAEMSCSYTFGSINKDQLKLTDVVCAG